MLTVRNAIGGNSLARAGRYSLEKNAKFGAQIITVVSLSRRSFSSFIRSSTRFNLLVNNVSKSFKQYRFYSSKFLFNCFFKRLIFIIFRNHFNVK